MVCNRIYEQFNYLLLEAKKLTLLEYKISLVCVVVHIYITDYLEEISKFHKIYEDL